MRQGRRGTGVVYADTKTVSEFGCRGRTARGQRVVVLSRTTVDKTVGEDVGGCRLGNTFFVVEVVGRAFERRVDRECIVVDSALREVVVDLLGMHFLLVNVFVRRLLRGRRLMLRRENRPWGVVLCEEKTCGLVGERNAF